MDSTAAITKRIATSDEPEVVKRALVTLFNIELKESGSSANSKTTYLRVLGELAETWESHAIDKEN
jgi:hypothetical protein